MKNPLPDLSSASPLAFLKRAWSAVFWPALAGLCWLLAAGCSTRPLSDPTFGKAYVPSNIYQSAPTLLPHVRVVAVLPLAADGSGIEAEAGREQMQPLVYAELARREAFEAVSVTPEQLEHWTGRKSWRADEALPPDFLEKVKKATACDGILFCRLSRYQAYPPLVLGWNFKLVDATGGSVWWSADVLFNAGEPEVALGARRHHKENFEYKHAASDSHTILNSPSRFGRYTLSALFATLPGR